VTWEHGEWHGGGHGHDMVMVCQGTVVPRLGLVQRVQGGTVDHKWGDGLG
jgi:hypothetical protein